MSPNLLNKLFSSIHVGLLLAACQLGFTPLALATCQLDYSYTAALPTSPRFFVRSGYSRGNDDPEQEKQTPGLAIPESERGNFETAIFDIELFGGRSTISGKTCVKARVTASLIELVSHSADEGTQFYMHVMPIYGWQSSSPARWVALTAEHKFASPFVVSPFKANEASYLKNDKYKAQRQVDLRAGVALESTVDLGEFGDGMYSGHIYLQRAPETVNNRPNFQNSNSASYKTVRHDLEWRLNLLEGLPAGDDIGLTNQIKFVSPMWDGKVVQTEEQRMVRKYHSVALMWRDVLVLNSSSQEYTRTNTMPDQNLEASAERSGRLRPKSEVVPPDTRQASSHAHTPPRSPAAAPEPRRRGIFRRNGVSP